METQVIEKGKKFEFDKIIEYQSKAIVSKTLIKKETGNISLFAFSKDDGLTEHTAGFDALIQVIDGEADIIINKNSNILKKGESIIMPANIPHAVKALSDFKMVLTMIKS